ncbi:MAG TPA: fasciclin domain-containing protein [Nocardioides sp.]
MNRSTLRRSSAIAAVAFTLSTGLAACSSDDAEPTASEETSAQESAEPATDSRDSGDSGESAAASGAAAQTFGPGCAAVPKDGAGSFDGMATAPVATAASANPLLETLVAAVGQAKLGDALNSAEGLTVFAPTNDAFAKIPAKDLDAVLKDKKLLTQILTHHVVPGQLSPEEVAGEHETLNKDMLTVEGSGEEFTVGDENAAVLCGNIPTANATVYVIDTVLMP